MAQAEYSKPTLGYWAIRGLASQIRYQMVYLGIDYAEVLYEQGDAPDYDRSCWIDVKDKLGLRFPNLPYFVDGESRLTDPSAIMKFISYKYGPELIGTTPAQMGKVEMVAQIVTDLKGAVTMPCYTQGDRVAITMSLLEKVKPLVNYLGENQYLCGNNVTYVDFIFFELCDFMDWISQGMLYERNPTLQAYHNRVKSLPRLAEFYADDRKCIKRPFNNKVAKLNN